MLSKNPVVKITLEKNCAFLFNHRSETKYKNLFITANIPELTINVILTLKL